MKYIFFQILQFKISVSTSITNCHLWTLLLRYIYQKALPGEREVKLFQYKFYENQLISHCQLAESRWHATPWKSKITVDLECLLHPEKS